MTNRTLTPDDVEAAKRLHRLWKENARRLNITQAKMAAKYPGWTQGLVSQYLNGYIALNTDATLKFAQTLRVRPHEIRPDLPPLQFAVTRRYLKVINTGATIGLPASSDDCFVFALDDQYAPKLTTGDYAVLDPGAEIKVGTRVLARTEDNKIYHLGVINRITKTVVSIKDRHGTDQLLPLSEYQVTALEALIVQ